MLPENGAQSIPEEEALPTGPYILVECMPQNNRINVQQVHYRNFPQYVSWHGVHTLLLDAAKVAVRQLITPSEEKMVRVFRGVPPIQTG